MLDETEAREFWNIFRDSPLFAGWKGVEQYLNPRLERETFLAGQAIFSRQETADCLYLIVHGVVVQSLKHGRLEWLRRRLNPGDYFGQHALFGDRHFSDTVAETEVVLCKMSAGDLRVALERNPELHEILLQEKRAGRLRAMPLLRSLDDMEVRRIASLMEEVSLDRGASVPLQKEGLWLIDFGQITVAGPASFDQSGWRLTAGNFFVSVDVGRAAQRAATHATAHLPSRLFYLPTEHFNRLLRAFSDVRQLSAARLDIAEELAKVELFQSSDLTDKHRQHLAQFCGWGFVPDQQNITTQGALGHSFVIIRDGLAVVTNFDEQGRARPMSYFRPGESYGETSLLSGKARDVTVRGAVAPAQDGQTALNGADVITLDRRDLLAAFEEQPTLWDNRIKLFKSFSHAKEIKRRYDWQREDEQIIWDGRGHRFWLAFPAAAPILLALLPLALIWLSSSALAGTTLVIWLLWLGMLALVEVWLFVNYYDDHYVVTNHRVTRYDRDLLALSEALMEAPIEMVQDVTIQAGFWGRFFDWGDVTIRTAAKVGAIVFAHAPQPDEVKQHILTEKAQAVAAVRGHQREVLRRLLISQLRVALPIPERQRALGDQAPAAAGSIGRRWRRLFGGRRAAGALQAPPTALPASQTALPRRILRWLARPLPARLRKALQLSAPAPAQPLSGASIWRKHPIALVKRAWLPLLTIVLLLFFFFKLEPIAGLFGLAQPTDLLLLWLFLFAVSAIVLWWQIADYRNDIYVLTDDKIIDIEMKPLGLDYKRREGSLERVQSVDFKRLGAISVLLNYGTVTIRTAAADEGYDFVMVSNPKHVQEVIFQKLAALRQRQETRMAADRQQELLEGLQVYSDLQGMMERPGSKARF